MAGRGNKKQKNNNYSNHKWLFAAYSRRSYDDGEKSESYTITNQKRIISNYLADCEDIIIEDYLSRIGRNHREVGKYLEEVFPTYNLRIISINDNVDSYLNPESMSNLIVPIKNLMNENYAIDISKKVKSAYVAMAKSGLYVAGTTPYGYKQDPDNKHHLIIDEKEKKIVLEIFQMALDGKGKVYIAKKLNERGILSRRELQYRNKHKLTLEPFDIESRYTWAPTTIGRMLSNEVYIGNLVQLKTERLSFGKTKSIEKKSEDCIRVENTHKGIIDKRTFNKVQQILKKRKISKKIKSRGSSIYRGKLKCYDCGSAMTKQEDFRGNRTVSNYFCMKHLYRSKTCTSHKIKTSVLNQCIIEMIQLQVKLVIDLEKSLKKRYFRNNAKYLEKEYKDNIRIANIRIEGIQKNKREAYQKWKLGEIEHSDYKILNRKYENEIKKYENQVENYSSTYKETLRRIRKNNSWVDHFKRNRRIKKLTKEIVNELIEDILVHEDGVIDVIFKYQDEYENMVCYLESDGVIDAEKMDDWNVSKAFS